MCIDIRVVVVVVVVVLPPKVPPDSPPRRARPGPPRPAAAARARGGVTVGVVLFDCCVFVGITEEATLGDDEYVRYHHGGECVKKLPGYPDAIVLPEGPDSGHFPDNLPGRSGSEIWIAG